MASFLFAPRGDEAASRRLRRRAAAGELRQLVPGVFYPRDGGSVEDAVRTHWPALVGHLFPDGVITDLTSLTFAPERDEASGLSYVFVSAPEAPKTIQIAKLVISQRRGAGKAEDDLPYMGAWIAGPNRQYLDNMTASRARSGPARTAGSAMIEARLERDCSAKGEEYLNRIRDGARSIAPTIGRDKEFEALDALIGSLLGSRKSKLVTRAGRARATGAPIDEACLDRLLILRTALLALPSEKIPDPNQSLAARQNSCFIEAFFSNYIEGTRFLVDEAREIVFDGKIPQSRPKDGHDVLGTYAKLMEPPRPRLSEMTPEQFILRLQADHADLMRQRPEINPGQFKERQNQAGNTVFVSPEKVRGTILSGFEHIRPVDDPFSRAMLAHFLISDIHPFVDGNGRMSRLVMSREMISHGLSHIVIPTVFRQDYLAALRALTRQNNPDILIRSLQKCQQISAACTSEDLGQTLARWASTHAFLEEDRHARLTAPTDGADVEWRDGVPAPKRYWEHVDFDRTGQDGFGALGR